jgi:DNA helicase HerA-like ATPase
MTLSDPTFLGTVAAVTGATVTVHLAESLASGLAVIGGHTYRVGQVGSFVRIPQGYQDLFAIVSEVGASALPAEIATQTHDTGRWMRVQLAGEAIGNIFERGISQHPNINDAVHLVTDQDLRRIYGTDAFGQAVIGTLSSAENIRVRVGLDALVTRHSAIVGSTGSGKSTTVASLIRSIATSGYNEAAYDSARILMLDVHGEYASALGDIADVYSAAPTRDQKQLFIPFWALEAGELLTFLTGGVSGTQEYAFTDKIFETKVKTQNNNQFAGVDPTSMTVDTPIPFSLKSLWYDMIDIELRTLEGVNRDQPALVDKGDAEMLVSPKYKPHAMGSVGPFLNTTAPGVRRQLNILRSRLLDRRFDFILHPGPWEPTLAGDTLKDLDELLQGWLGSRKPITILDLSAVPSAVLIRLVGSILKITYESLYWSREKTEGGVLRPLLVVMEEAHRYLGSASGNAAAEIVQRIVKEGRKYGIGAMIVSQRPSEIDETILSQCGTFFTLRLANPQDRARIQGSLPDHLSGLMELLPVLRTGEAIITGEAARLPLRCRISLPPERYRPQSRDPEVAAQWALKRRTESYARVVASWRSQRTTAVAVPTKIERKPVDDTSSDRDS